MIGQLTAFQEEALRSLLICARAWEPDARLLGNVRAGDIVEALEAVLEEPIRVPTWDPYFGPSHSFQIPESPPACCHEWVGGNDIIYCRKCGDPQAGFR